MTSRQLRPSAKIQEAFLIFGIQNTIQQIHLFMDKQKIYNSLCFIILIFQIGINIPYHATFLVVKIVTV